MGLHGIEPPFMCLSAQQMDCSNVFEGFDQVMNIHFTTEHLSMFKEDRLH